jgi:putative ABC transport system permease protein
MDAFVKDVKQSIRIFLRSPGFTVTAVAALALGIGGTTAIFSIVNTVLLRPLRVPDPDRLVVLATTSGDGSAASRQSSCTGKRSRARSRMFPPTWGA